MVSIIIPALNEARLLPATLDAIRANRTVPTSAAKPCGIEIIVADGGSRDHTAQLSANAGARYVVCPKPQRAAQMNQGARLAQGETLLFLHADTLLPNTALRTIEAALADARIVGGGFARRFGTPSRFLRVTCLLADCRCRRLGWFLGDQAMFVRRRVFQALRGFREVDGFEDLDFSRRLARSGRVVTLGPPVVSSARRFVARGAVLTTCADVWLTCRYLLGASPERLVASRSVLARREAGQDGLERTALPRGD